MRYWYSMDAPRSRPCWEVNPILWDFFCKTASDRIGKTPKKNVLYTEEHVVQILDREYFKIEEDGK